MNTLAIALAICAVGILLYLIERFRFDVLEKLRRDR
tara:strand:+ start:54856 stop:54963 length:108 start_codon:yes stop_codon:yes gene_type:complete